MPYVQQNRPVLGSRAYFNAQWYHNATKLGMDLPVEDYRGNQQTYSWRTQKRGQDDYVDYEGLTGPELRARLDDEYSTRYDNGHEFSTVKTSFTYTGNESVKCGWYLDFPGGDRNEYRGPLRPQPSSIDLWPTNFTPPSNHTLDLKGSAFIGVVAPTANEAAFATFLGEILRDGLPWIPGLKAFRERSLNTRKGSDEYLNYVFGVKPFAGDLQRMAIAVKTAAKRMKQLTRDSDRVVRRKHSFAEESWSTIVGEDTSKGFLGLPRYNFTDPPYDSIWSTIPPQRVVDTVTQQYSFSGAFTYHLAQADSFLSMMDMYAEKADHLLGFEINLETIWDLSRWSWLIDWFANVHGFLHNIDLLHSNSLVLRYGYVMCHTKALRTRVVEGLIPKASWPFIGFSSHDTLVSEARYEQKVRRRATPYGFGLDVSSFSDTQWAILGALGLSRAPGKLRHNE